MYAKFPIKWSNGDLLPTIKGTVAYDLTAYTVTLYIKRADNSILVKEAVIDAGEDESTFEFVWVDGDLTTGLNQLCELRVVNPDGKPMTEKFLIDVVFSLSDEA